MPHNLTGNFLATAKGFLGPEIVDNRLNPVLLATATSGYRIQSHLLHIPDRFGFFLPGPPRLQVYQGAFFAFVVTGTCFSIVLGGFALLLMKLNGRPISPWLVVAMATMTVATVVTIWALACFDRHRAPDYDWGDWKWRMAD